MLSQNEMGSLVCHDPIWRCLSFFAIAQKIIRVEVPRDVMRFESKVCKCESSVAHDTILENGLMKFNSGKTNM